MFTESWFKKLNAGIVLKTVSTRVVPSAFLTVSVVLGPNTGSFFASPQAESIKTKRIKKERGIWDLNFINEISIRSKVILKDNYETLNFTSKMRSILDEHPLPLSDQARELFNRQLALEEKNITEAGEGKAVAALKLAYTKLIDPSATPAAIQEAIAKIRWQLKLIDDLKMF